MIPMLACWAPRHDVESAAGGKNIAAIQQVRFCTTFAARERRGMADEYIAIGCIAEEMGKPGLTRLQWEKFDRETR